MRPLRDDITTRTRYYERLREFMEALEMGRAPESVKFDDMSGLYGLAGEAAPAFKAAPDSVVLLGRRRLEKLLEISEVRYSAVYMDIVGLIAAGHYKKGDKLPTHKELQKIYGVSVDTTIKAVQVLQEWGVVKTVRGNGIFVEMDKNGIQEVQVPPRLIACHVRRYLDTLELLTLTVEGAAACAVPNVTQSDIETAKAEIGRLWNEDYLYGRTPAVLLDFITEHLGVEALGAIYAQLRRNLRIGRSIPGLLTTEKTPVNCAIHEQCSAALHALSTGNQEAFPAETVRAFTRIYRLVLEECGRLGYLESAMKAYDGTALWK